MKFPTFHLLSGVAILLLTTVLTTACSTSDAPADAETLLQTVPANTAKVILINITDLINHNGGKVDATQIKDGENIRKSLAKQYPALDVTSLFDGESGIRFTAAVNFTDNAADYLTFLVEDGEQFRNYITAKAGTQWTKTGKLYTTHSMAQLGNQVWYSNSLDPDKVTEYAGLTKARSFLSNDYSKKLTECDHDAIFYISVAGMLDMSNISFSERTTIRMATSMLFDDLAAIAGYADFKDKEITVVGDMINTKGEIAGCNLKLGKLDIKQIAALNGNANYLIALSLPHELIDQILKSAESFGGTMPSLYKNILTPIDGTIAFATSTRLDRPSTDAAFTASIATQGNQASLMEFLYSVNLKPVSDGNLLKINSGNYGDGAFKIADAAKDLEGASFGLVMHSDDSNTVITILKHEGGLRIKGSCHTDNPIIDAFPMLLGHK
ncbi:MAG: hypothetical protein K2H86_05335 [Muribaculaceae bacterium]|nr:hypothetical protein [Muribaculaceae bacterium]